MGAKKGGIVRKIEVHTDTPAQYELGIQLLTYSGGGNRGNRGRGRKAQGRKLQLSRGGSGGKA